MHRARAFGANAKRQWISQRPVFENIEEARLSIFEYIEGYYYNKRLHQGLNYQTPREIEEEFLRKDEKTIEMSLTR